MRTNIGNLSSRVCSSLALLAAGLLLALHPSGALASTSEPAPYWANEQGSSLIASDRWIVSTENNLIIVWSTDGRVSHTTSFACTNKNWGIVAGIAPIRVVMSGGGVLYATISAGSVASNQFGSNGPELGTERGICDAVGAAADPSGAEGNWTNPATGQSEEGMEVLISSTDDGVSWHLAAGTVTASLVPQPLSSLDYEGNTFKLLVPLAEGVRLGNPLIGYASFSPSTGWSSVGGAGSTFGYIYTPTNSYESLQPGTTAKGYKLAKTRRLSDGSIWSLWESQGAFKETSRVAVPAVIVRTLNGRVLSRVDVDPSFRLKAFNGGSIISPGCSEPQSAVATGIVSALPSDDGSTLYASTPRTGAYSCHNKYVNVDQMPVVPVLLVSHDGGHRWSRVPMPNLGPYTRLEEVLAVSGSSPIVALESNRHECEHREPQGQEPYERLNGTHWMSLGCHKIEYN